MALLSLISPAPTSLLINHLQSQEEEEEEQCETVMEEKCITQDTTHCVTQYVKVTLSQR